MGLEAYSFLALKGRDPVKVKYLLEESTTKLVSLARVKQYFKEPFVVARMGVLFLASNCSTYFRV